MQIKRIEFEPPIPTASPKPFSCFVCVAYTEDGIAISGCDKDSPEDAFVNAKADAEDTGRCILPHTVQMFRVDGAA